MAVAPGLAAAQLGADLEVGHVSSVAEGASPGAVSALRQALSGAAASLGRAGRSGPSLVLSAAVTRLDQERLGDRLRVRCEISVLVLENPGGALRVLLTGRAVSTGGLPRSRLELERFERGVVTSAAASAIEGLRDVLDGGPGPD